MIWDSCLSNGVATFNCFPILFGNVVNALLAFAGTAALFFIIFAGIKFITSGGDAKQVEGARKTLTYAVIGLVVILSAFFILNVIAGVTNAPCVKDFNCR